MTPFEVGLKHELDVERLRFANEWLFDWHKISMPGRTVDVENFEGRRIRVGGVKFSGVQPIYWQAVARYLIGKAHAVVGKWDEATRGYPLDKRTSSLDGTGALLRSFTSDTIQRAVKTDRALRGGGNPESVHPYNASGEHSRTNAEISRLVESNKSLIEGAAVPGPPRLPFKIFEDLQLRYPGTLVIAGLLVALVALAASVF